MNSIVRKVALLIGLGALGISMYWSQGGFDSAIAGSSSGTDMALYIAWFLAFAATAFQFIFSSNFKELNPSLIFFGLLAYGYSIYTNYQGIIDMQGTEINKGAAGVLALLMDAAAEPAIAWGLYVSREGDLIGNIFKTIGATLESAVEENKQKSTSGSHNQTKSGHSSVYGQKKGGSGDFRSPSGKKSPRFNLHSVNDGMITKELADDDTKPLFRN